VYSAETGGRVQHATTVSAARDEGLAGLTGRLGHLGDTLV
jgi:hypothetical protein